MARLAVARLVKGRDLRPYVEGGGRLKVLRPILLHPLPKVRKPLTGNIIAYDNRYLWRAVPNGVAKYIVHIGISICR